MLAVIERIENHLSDQKRYCSVAILNLKKLDLSPTNPRIQEIIVELEAYRKSLNNQ